MTNVSIKHAKLSARSQVAIAAVVICLALGALLISKADRGASADADVKSQTKRDDGKFYPTAAQWATLTVQQVEPHVFRSEFRTEGKVAIDEHRATRIFSPFAGRVTKLHVAPGEEVKQGQVLFEVAAADSVDAQKDFVAAVATLNKARSQVNLSQIIERRMETLIKDKAMPLKDWQEAQANLLAAKNDLRAAEVALEAVRNRLRLLGKTDAEIDAFEKTGVITPAAPVYSPLAGTVLQRKVGPGQYVNAGASDSDPVFLIGDISNVWLVAFVRESDSSKVKAGQPIRFTVLASPDRVFEGKISYVASLLDPSSRRLLVRASVDNADGLLKPEMFASVTIITDEGSPQPAVPREAVIYEGSSARVWVAFDDRSIEMRQITLGIANERLIQVLAGLQPGEKVIARGSLFIDRAASGAAS